MRVGGCQQKLDVGRGFFQCLQQRIEAAGRQHVHLVDQIHLVTPLGRRVLNVVQQLAGIFDLGSRRGIDFDQVDEAPLVNRLTARALATRGRRDALVTTPIGGAVQALGQYPCQGGLADATRAGEQVRVVQTPLVKSIDQGALDMGLPHKLVECAWPPFTGQNLIAHGAKLPWALFLD